MSLFYCVTVKQCTNGIYLRVQFVIASLAPRLCIHFYQNRVGGRSGGVSILTAADDFEVVPAYTGTTLRCFKQDQFMFSAVYSATSEKLNLCYAFFR